jgi:hypothetical protein
VKKFFLKPFSHFIEKKKMVKFGGGEFIFGLWTYLEEKFKSTTYFSYRSVLGLIGPLDLKVQLIYLIKVS